MQGNFGGGKIWQISVWSAPHASRVTCILRILIALIIKQYIQ